MTRTDIYVMGGVLVLVAVMAWATWLFGVDPPDRAAKPTATPSLAVIPNTASPQVPTVRLVPPKDKNNMAWEFMRCSRGNKGGCAKAGAWIAAHAQAGRKLRMCLHAINGGKGGKDLMQCLDLEARWPE